MMWKLLSLCAVVLATSRTEVLAASWSVIQDESEIAFTGEQMGVPTSAEFSAFNGEVEFDRENLAESAVRVTIDVASVMSSYPVLAQVLRQEPWFNAAAFPEAVFEAAEFTPRRDGSLEARGTLTLRGVTRPVTLFFSFLAYGPDAAKSGWDKAVMEGEATVQRTAFGVGQGEWGGTDIVADEVSIRVRLTAERRSVP